MASTRAERSVTEVRVAYGFLDRRTFPRPRGRLRLAATPAASPEYLVVPYMASIAEEFSRELLLEGTGRLIPAHPSFLTRMWEGVEREAELSWERQGEAWRGWHGIDFDSAAEYQSLRGVIDARNALVHGLGDLTRRQTRKDGGTAVKGRLASVGITVVGRRLVIDRAVAAQCSDVVTRFILWLDQHAGSHGVAFA